MIFNGHHGLRDLNIDIFYSASHVRCHVCQGQDGRPLSENFRRRFSESSAVSTMPGIIPFILWSDCSFITKKWCQNLSSSSKIMDAKTSIWIFVWIFVSVFFSGSIKTEHSEFWLPKSPLMSCVAENISAQGSWISRQSRQSPVFLSNTSRHWIHRISLILYLFQIQSMIQFWVMQIQLSFRHFRQRCNFAIETAPDGPMGCCNSREKTTVVDSSNVTLTRFHLGPLEVDADGVLLKLGCMMMWMMMWMMIWTTGWLGSAMTAMTRFCRWNMMKCLIKKMVDEIVDQKQSYSERVILCVTMWNYDFVFSFFL